MSYDRLIKCTKQWNVQYYLLWKINSTIKQWNIQWKCTLQQVNVQWNN